jgi:hypothetical protein
VIAQVMGDAEANALLARREILFPFWIARTTVSKSIIMPYLLSAAIRFYANDNVSLTEQSGAGLAGASNLFASPKADLISVSAHFAACSDERPRLLHSHHSHR